MPRRKQLKISAKELSIFNSIVEELKQNPLYQDYDMDTLEFTILKKKAPPKIKDVEKAIENLERYVHINKDKIEMLAGIQMINKKKLARMLGISRPTLDKWIQSGFIKEPQYFRQISGTYYQTNDVLEQLRKINS